MDSLAATMDRLAGQISEIPADLDVEVTVTTKVNDDVPPMFAEYVTDADDQTGYKRIVATREGVVSKSIILWIRD